MLDAVVRLVSRKGFDSVSIRDVTGEAKANVAAVNYHFGSREGLMDLVVTQILDPLCTARLMALEEAENKAAGKMVPVGETVGLFVKALDPAALQPEMDSALFFKLAGRILVLPDGAMLPSLAELRREVNRRFVEALARALPGTPAAGLSASWAFFEAGLGQSLVAAGGAEIAGLMDRWIAFGVRGLGESETSGSKRKEKDDPQGLLFEF
jgi:AcrR family transcriptional regulator